MARLRRINPATPILAVVYEDLSTPALLYLTFYNPATKSLDVRRWLDAEAYGADEHHGHEGHGDQGHVHGTGGRHDDHIRHVEFLFFQTGEAQVKIGWAVLSPRRAGSMESKEIG
jgi:G3E family GTPase